MSRLIASILLSVLVFPIAAVFYLIIFFLSDVTLRQNEEVGLLVAGVATWAFVAWYWITVWRKTVKWTAARVARTAYAAVAAALGGVVAWVAVAILSGGRDEEFVVFIASVTPPLLWLVASVLVWRETDAERSVRLRAQGRGGDGPGVPCPTCGYDMTGLKSTRCPECGSEFTIDELIAAQPGRAAVELER